MAQREEVVGTSAIEALRQMRRLPVRLNREIPWGRSIGCALLMGVLLTGIAVGFGSLLRHGSHMFKMTRGSRGSSLASLASSGCV
ncbi:MAG TPA: hypothetical protein VGM98_13190 [Schlesneria sp.]